MYGSELNRMIYSHLQVGSQQFQIYLTFEVTIIELGPPFAKSKWCCITMWIIRTLPYRQDSNCFWIKDFALRAVKARNNCFDSLLTCCIHHKPFPPSPVQWISVVQVNHSAVSCWRSTAMCIIYCQLQVSGWAQIFSRKCWQWNCNRKKEILFFGELNATRNDWSVAKLNFQEQLTASRGSLVYVLQVSLMTLKSKMLEVEGRMWPIVTEGQLDWLYCLHLGGFLYFQFSMD